MCPGETHELNLVWIDYPDSNSVHALVSMRHPDGEYELVHDRFYMAQDAVEWSGRQAAEDLHQWLIEVTRARFDLGAPTPF